MCDFCNEIYDKLKDCYTRNVIKINYCPMCERWCWYCECSEEATGEAICSLGIGDFVNVNDGCCFAFEYDPDFVRW